jgi:hypothetical protein
LDEVATPLHEPSQGSHVGTFGLELPELVAVTGRREQHLRAVFVGLVRERLAAHRAVLVITASAVRPF